MVLRGNVALRVSEAAAARGRGMAYRREGKAGTALMKSYVTGFRAEVERHGAQMRVQRAF